ncbi:MAG TPA: patatin-like phospholipase family protein [Bdellovibrio sp.]|uniref:patatin-like phospholipase family protein n=1 Tax=Bdellovibrio sp. TaxID=28201 RepID=UPI002EF60AFA
MNQDKVRKRKRIGIVMTGGGARAAYQAGVLRGMAEITGEKKNPFSIISGYSAGALNGAWLASQKGDFLEVTEKLWDTWSSLTAEKVFKVDTFSLAQIALRWIKDRSIGGLLGQKKQITYLLDTTPLAKLISESIDFSTLNSNIENGLFHAVSFSATNYRSGQSVAFYNGHSEIQDWKRLNRISLRTRFEPHHVMASSAIPIFFPPVKIADSFYGDGMVRLNSPLSAAIHLESEKLLVIGVRGPSGTSHPANLENTSISVGEIVGTVLNGLFFDSLDADLDRITRINSTVAAMSDSERASQPFHLREIPLLALTPTREITEMSSCHISQMPLSINILLRGIGVSAGRGSELLSYLAFEPSFIKSLLEAGYNDTLQRKETVLKFLADTE